MTGRADPLGAMYRANQVFHEQTLETHSVSCGIVCYSQEFPTLGNQFRDVMLVGSSTAADAHVEVEAFYARLGRTCTRWVPSLYQPAEPLQKYLHAFGFVPAGKTVMQLNEWRDLPSHQEVRIVPARAMRSGLTQLMLDDAALGGRVQREFANHVTLKAMESPSFEMVLAMIDGKPVGHGGLLQVGPVAAIYSVYVEAAARRRGAALAIMTDLLTRCRRLELRTVVLEVEEENTPAINLYNRCGFGIAGASVEFRQASRA